MLRQEWVNVNARMGRAGDTGLHVASEKGHLNVVKFLLGFGRKNLNLNIENDRGAPRCHWQPVADTGLSRGHS